METSVTFNDARNETTIVTGSGKRALRTDQYGNVEDVPENASATKKYLRQASSAVPEFDTVDAASTTGTPYTMQMYDATGASDPLGWNGGVGRCLVGQGFNVAPRWATPYDIVEAGGFQNPTSSFQVDSSGIITCAEVNCAGDVGAATVTASGDVIADRFVSRYSGAAVGKVIDTYGLEDGTGSDISMIRSMDVIRAATGIPVTNGRIIDVTAGGFMCATTGTAAVANCTALRLNPILGQLSTSAQSVTSYTGVEVELKYSSANAAHTLTSAYGLHVKPDAMLYPASQTATTTAVGAHISSPGNGNTTNEVAVYADSLQVGGTISGVAAAGSIKASGDFAVNTNKFNVTASSGDTTVAGTLSVTGTLSGTVDVSTRGYNLKMVLIESGSKSAVTSHTIMWDTLPTAFNNIRIVFHGSCATGDSWSTMTCFKSDAKEDTTSTYSGTMIYVYPTNILTAQTRALTTKMENVIHWDFAAKSGGSITIHNVHSTAYEKTVIIDEMSDVYRMGSIYRWNLASNKCTGVKLNNSSSYTTTYDYWVYAF